VFKYVALSLAMMVLPSLALATGKPEEPKQPTQEQVQGQAQAQKAKASAASKAAAASKAKSTARAEGGSSEIVDESSTDDHSTVNYEAEKQAAASVAGIETGFCGGPGFSASTRGAGLSLTDQSYICGRMELRKGELEIAEALFAAADAMKGTTKTPGGNPLAQDAVLRGLRHVALAEEHQAKASRRLDEDDTALRRFFVRTFGSLPRPLSLLAPR
jgi:hypothetical protein